MIDQELPDDEREPGVCADCGHSAESHGDPVVKAKLGLECVVCSIRPPEYRCLGYALKPTVRPS